MQFILEFKTTLFQDVEAKYSKFVDLKKSEQVVFLSNNIDPNKTLIVYKIKCRDCQASYIGETGRNLSTRLTEHKRARKSGDVDNHIAEHHLQTTH